MPLHQSRLLGITGLPKRRRGILQGIGFAPVIAVHDLLDGLAADRAEAAQRVADRQDSVSVGVRRQAQYRLDLSLEVQMSLLEPVQQAVGSWNFQDETLVRIMGGFNGFLKAVILRANEARNLEESNRFKFYDHMKRLIASPPDTLRVDEKFTREYQILNCRGVIITTNHKTDGIYLPAEDRRHYVAWSDRMKEDEHFAGDYWTGLYTYYRDGGNEAMAAFLMRRDISGFDPKAPPSKTAAFFAIVDANRPA
jgi:hypothetical protein